MASLATTTLTDAERRAAGLSPYVGLSVVLMTPESIWRRRAIEAFYIQEVDRDKIVLAGGEVDAPPDFEWHEAGDDGVRERTREHLAQADEHLRLAPAGLDISRHRRYVVKDATKGDDADGRGQRTFSGVPGGRRRLRGQGPLQVTDVRVHGQQPRVTMTPG